VGEAEKMKGIAQMHQALATYRATGAGASNALYLCLLAQRYEQGNQITKAHSALEEAFTWVTNSGERWCDAELHRLNGTLLLHQTIPDDLQAECSFQQALDIARRQQAKSWELRASVSLSRLWLRQGRRTEARLLLSEIFNWFDEGLGTPDLQEASELLTDLARHPH
jgi:predicted ATPase